MTEQISIKNFLIIKEANLEIKKINIIIGPQANGKSVIAKLTYYFKSISEIFLESIRTNDSKRDLDKKLLVEFEERFPRYAWEGTAFSIKYQIDDLDFHITGNKTSKGKTTLGIKYNQSFVLFYNTKRKQYQGKLVDLKKDSQTSKRQFDRSFHIFYDEIVQPCYESEFNRFFSNAVFIPASRSFFANLQKNIFTFLASNLDIDPFLKDFGKLYESTKKWYKDDIFRSNVKISEKIDKSLQAIIHGDYEYKDEQDWIISKGKRINLANASSGQQESLPMLLVLCVYPFFREDQEGNMFFIEEPEAHLFPTSQGYIISILSLLYKHVGTNFFITTHSPYVLSALNNFIMAADALDENKITEEYFTHLNGSGVPIRFEDISAYTVTDGITNSIIDVEYRMIGGHLLDSVSEHFESVMHALLNCGCEN
jgi:predicted ATPase